MPNSRAWSARGLGSILPEPEERATARKIVQDWMRSGHPKEWWAPGREEKLIQAIAEALIASRKKVLT